MLNTCVRTCPPPELMSQFTTRPYRCAKARGTGQDEEGKKERGGNERIRERERGREGERRRD
eukprot:1357328-Amorphochlora_amoeboformis.AAC.1